MNNKKAPVVLVCVTNQRDCARLIEAGDKISKQIDNSRVCVFSVRAMKNAEDSDAAELEFLRQKAYAVNAEMTVVFDNDAAGATAKYAVDSGAVHIVTGVSGNPGGGFIEILRELLPDKIISMVSKDGIVRSIYPMDECPYQTPLRKI